jgi:anti-sigma regulatory factor (Ser/Thr protein kinase)
VLELSLHILDALQNSVEAGASRITLEIDEDPDRDRLEIVIVDDGRGMDPEMVQRVFNPFVTSRTTRHVGLGIPLFAEAARRCEGDLVIESEKNKGTRLKVWFRYHHWDRAPLGDMPSVLLTLLLAPRPVNILYTHRRQKEEFVFDSEEAREILGDVPFSQPQVRAWLQETLKEGEDSIRKGRES